MGDSNIVPDLVLKAMIAVAAADGHLDTREVALIQKVHKAREGNTLTADEIARAADVNAKGDVMAAFDAASPTLDKEAKAEIIQCAYRVLLADRNISGEERKVLKDIATALKIPEIHFGAILEDLAVTMQNEA